MLEDGSYDAIIVDAEAVAEGDEHHFRVELTILSGPHKGEMVVVTGPFPGRTDGDLMGLPATLVVDSGTPRITVEG
jgi:hypothetical protein